MNKAELIEEVALKSNLTKKDAEAAVDAVIDVITEALVGGKEVKLSGFSGPIKDAGVGQSSKVKGYGLSLTGDAPLLGGKAMFGIGYTDAETADSQDKAQDVDFQRYVVSVGYDYPFSKRTDVYAVASYMQDNWEEKMKKEEGDPSAYTFYIGLRHRF